MDEKSQLRDFVSRLLRSKGDEQPFDDGEPLASEGRLDSLEIIELVDFMERSFGVDFARAGFERDDFDGIARMCAFVERSAARP